MFAIKKFIKCTKTARFWNLQSPLYTMRFATKLSNLGCLAWINFPTPLQDFCNFHLPKANKQKTLQLEFARIKKFLGFRYLGLGPENLPNRPQWHYWMNKQWIKLTKRNAAVYRRDLIFCTPGLSALLVTIRRTMVSSGLVSSSRQGTPPRMNIPIR